MKKRLVFATNNAHKLEEIRAILGNSIEILSLAAIVMPTFPKQPILLKAMPDKSHGTYTNIMG